MYDKHAHSVDCVSACLKECIWVYRKALPSCLNVENHAQRLFPARSSESVAKVLKNRSTHSFGPFRPLNWEGSGSLAAGITELKLLFGQLQWSLAHIQSSPEATLHPFNSLMHWQRIALMMMGLLLCVLIYLGKQVIAFLDKNREHFQSACSACS